MLSFNSILIPLFQKHSFPDETQLYHISTTILRSTRTAYQHLLIFPNLHLVHSFPYQMNRATDLLLTVKNFQANQVNNSSNPSTPPITNETLSASVNAMNAMRASMDSIRSMDAMRSSVMDMSSPQPSQQPDAIRMQQHAEALLRQQAEAALRLAMSQVKQKK